MKYAWIAASICLSATAWAAEPPHGGPGGHGGPQPRFENMDTDGDGKVSRVEAEKNAPRLAQRFDQLDTNKDGGLTKDELHAGMRQGADNMRERGQEAFKNADKNGDGKLSKEEAGAMPRVSENFSAVDTDGDGFVTQEELRAHMQSRMRDRMKNRGQ